MTAVWYRFRAELRRRWSSIAVLALLAGLAGGVALAAIAGARRTDTAYDRLVRATDAPDVLVNPDLGSDSRLDARAVEAIPRVFASGRENGLNVLGLGKHSVDFTNDIVFGDADGVGTSIARAKILDGRRPDPHRADEVVVNGTFARRHHVHPGVRMRVAVLSANDLARLQSGEFVSFSRAIAAVRAGQLGERVTLTIVGVYVTPDGIVVDQGFENGEVHLTPAFLHQHPSAATPYFGVLARLRGGARTVPAFRTAVNRLPHQGSIAFQTNAATAAKVDRAVQPWVDVLTIFGIVVALTGALTVGQALSRQTFLDSLDFTPLRGLGFSSRQLMGATMLRAAVTAAAATVIAIALAIAVSPLTPLGPARVAEPHPGLRVDWFVAGVGGVGVLLVVLALAVVPAWRYARVSERDRAATSSSRLARALSGGATPVPAAAGVRMALEPGRGRTAVPVFSTIASVAVAIAALTGALVFASSLDHLASTPRLYGWNWDARLSIDSDTVPQSVQRQVADLLDRSPRVTAWSTAVFSDLVLNGHAVPALGIEPGRGAVIPSVVSGRMPRGPHEIALGGHTLRSLDRGVGDDVTVTAPDGHHSQLHVVARVVLPGTGTYSGSDKTALGEGAVVTRAALDRLAPKFTAHSFLVDFRNGGDRKVVVRQVRAVVHGDDPEAVTVQGVQRPSDIIEYGRVRNLPIVLAGVLALLAVATIAHALITSVRRRRRDYALFKTLGFTRRQVSSTVAWQATTVGMVALLVGLPAGVVLGRWGWHVLSDNLGTVAEPVVPLVGIAIAIPTVLLLANVVAFVPGRIAARLRPATVLRSE